MLNKTELVFEINWGLREYRRLLRIHDSYAFSSKGDFMETRSMHENLNFGARKTKLPLPAFFSLLPGVD